MHTARSCAASTVLALGAGAVVTGTIALEGGGATGTAELVGVGVVGAGVVGVAVASAVGDALAGGGGGGGGDRSEPHAASVATSSTGSGAAGRRRGRGRAGMRVDPRTPHDSRTESRAGVSYAGARLSLPSVPHARRRSAPCHAPHVPDGRRYARQYCEENVWWLARDRTLAGDAAEVVVVSNLGRTVLVHAQQAGDDGAPVVWDYHVVLATRAPGGVEAAVEVWDLDSTLGAPLPAHRWLDASFDPATPSVLAPLFHVVPVDLYLCELASDRRHMRTPDGGWIAPPPPWPPIGGGAHDLERWIDFASLPAGAVLDAAGLRAHWSR